MKKIGIVTVLYNSNNLLSDFFSSIAMQDYANFTVYLVDNTPSESTRLKISELKDKYYLANVIHIENTQNVGAAEGNNVGIKQALSDGCNYLILCNNDIYFSNPRLFSTLIFKAETKHLQIIAPKIYFANSNKIWYAGGGIIDWKAAVIHYGNGKVDNPHFNLSGPTGYAPTTFVLLNARVFNDVPMLDSTYFIYTEDLDFMFIAKAKGHTIWYDANIFIYHKESSTTGGVFSNIGLFYNARNRIYFARKFYPKTKKIIAIGYVIVSMLYHAFRQKRINAIMSVSRGFFQGLLLRVSKEKLPQL